MNKEKLDSKITIYMKENDETGKCTIALQSSVSEEKCFVMLVRALSALTNIDSGQILKSLCIGNAEPTIKEKNESQIKKEMSDLLISLGIIENE
jgi:hypothetical protein